MTWIAILAGLALLGLVALAIHAAQLRHRFDDVHHEVAVVADRARQVTALLGRLELPPGRRD